MKRKLRLAGIIFMAMTSAFTLLGGVGTTCVALDPTTADNKFITLAPYQWLYIVYVLAGIAIGILGVQATIYLIKGNEKGESSALLALILGIITGGAHMYSSRTLRGSSMPTDMVVYFTILTLILFLIFKLPKIRDMGLFKNQPGDTNGAVGGLSAIIMGFLLLTVQMWAGSDHLINGINFADAFHGFMYGFGSIMVMLGTGILVRSILFPRRKTAAEQPIR